MTTHPQFSAGHCTRESAFSTVISGENLNVMFSSSAENASFDLLSRRLTLPIYKKSIPDYLVDTLIYHEVAHAIYSEPDEYLDLARKYGKNCANVFEDVIIEHKIKQKYPGAAKIMPRGHYWKYANLLDHMNLDDSSLLTRLMAYFKTGGAYGFQFTDDESEFIDTVECIRDDGGTTRDLLEAWVSYQKNREPDANYSEDDDNPAPWVVPAGFDRGPLEVELEESEDDADDDEESEDDAETGEDDAETGEDDAETGEDDAETGEESEDDAETGEESEDDADADEDFQEYDEELEEFDESALIENGGDPDQTYVKTISLSNIEALIEKVRYSFADHLKGCGATHDISDPDVFNPSTAKRYQNINRATDDIAHEMSIQFNQLSNARGLSSESCFDSGELDSDILTEYRTRDDIFSQEIVRDEQPNHGFFMLLDFSGSMGRIGKNSSFYRVIEQSVVKIKFAQMIGMPIRVFAFTAAHGGFGWGLCEIYSDRWSDEDQKIALRGLLTGLTARNGRYGGKFGYHRTHAGKVLDRMLGATTPLDTCIAAIPLLVSDLNCDKLSVTVLTDGLSKQSYIPGAVMYGFGDGLNPGKFVIPELSNKHYLDRTTGYAEFLKDCLPDAHLTYYYLCPYRYGYYPRQAGIVEFDQDVTDKDDRRNYDPIKFGEVQLIEHDAKKVRGWDSVFVFASAVEESESWNQREKTDMMERLGQSKTFQTLMKKGQDRKTKSQFAEKFIQKIA